MFRSNARGFRVIAIALLVIVTAWGALWFYAEYEVHRAKSMLVDASRVRVGDTEASVLTLVERYGGFKRIPEPLPPRDQWFDKEEFDYQQRHLSDYRYEIDISPFGITGPWPSRLTQVKRALVGAVPTRVRPALGMRDWGTAADFSIRGNRVRAVSAVAVFPGHSEWLGHSWELAEDMPSHDMPASGYLIGAATLTMPGGGGEMIENYLTKKASQEETDVARRFNTGCLVSLTGCSGLCEVAPRALLYLREKPDAHWNIVPPKCPAS